MIQDYYQLTCKLTHDYIGSLHDNKLKEDKKSGDSLTQFFVYENEDKTQLESVFSIMKLTGDKMVVNVWKADGGAVSAASVDWTQMEAAITLPVDEINVSGDVIAEFNKVVGGQLNGRRASGARRASASESRGSVSERRGSTSERRASVSDKSERSSVVDRELPRVPEAGAAAAGSAAAARVDQPGRRIPDRPEFEDELQMRNRPGVTGIRPGIDGPIGTIGDDDLYPGGIKNPSIAPGLDPLAERSSGAGGMYPSRDHPLFRRMGDPSHPTGARYDDPLTGNTDPDTMEMPGLPAFRRSSGGQGGGPFPGFGNFGGSNGFGPI